MAGSQVTPRTLALGGLAVALAVLLYFTIWPAGSADTQGSGQIPVPARRAQGADPVVPPALGLEGLDAPRAEPANRRDLFRFGAVAPAPVRQADPAATPESAPSATSSEAPSAVDAAPSQPQPALIPLRYVGYAETPGTGKVAALSDGRFTYHGREGDVIEGRWRVVSIGVESLVIEWVDGTGRQTLRLQ